MTTPPVPHKTISFLVNKTKVATSFFVGFAAGAVSLLTLLLVLTFVTYGNAHNLIENQVYLIGFMMGVLLTVVAGTIGIGLMAFRSKKKGNEGG